MIGLARGLHFARRATTPTNRAVSIGMNAPLRMGPVAARAMSNHTTVYTDTDDEAPYLATYSLLPIFQKPTGPFGIGIVRLPSFLACGVLFGVAGEDAEGCT